MGNTQYSLPDEEDETRRDLNVECDLVEQYSINKKFKRNLSQKIAADANRVLYKTWDTVALCSYNEWLLSNEQYTFKNVNKSFSCKGKCQETCTNGFCLYTMNNQTQKRLLSNRKFSYYSNDYHLRYQLKNFFTLKKKKYVVNSEAKKIFDHFKYNHLPAMFSSFHHYNVKGLIKGNFNDFSNETSNTLLLINIYSEITEKTRFILINLKTTKFLTIFGDYNGYINANDVYAQWSPDLTKLFIRINNNNHLNNDLLDTLPEQGSVSIIDLYDISKRDGKLLKRFKYFHKTVIFCFNPTYKHSKIAITDYYQQTPNSLFIIDLESNNDKITKLLSCSQNVVSDLSRNACDIKFSLDGSYIIVTIGDNICCCRALPHGLSECKYLIFDAYSCQLLKYYSSHLTICTIHACPLNYLPKINTCQSLMAIPKKYLSSISDVRNEDGEELAYYNLSTRLSIEHSSSDSTNNNNNILSRSTKILRNFPFLSCSSSNSNTTTISLSKVDSTLIRTIHMPCNLSLKNLSRIIVVRNIKQLNLINELPLPQSVKSYLLYRPEMV